MTLEQAQHIARYNQQQQNPYVGNNFQGQGWRNNQNFPWKNTQNSGQPMQSNIQPKEKKVDLEEALAHMMTSHTAFMNERRPISKTKLNSCKTNQPNYRIKEPNSET